MTAGAARRGSQVCRVSTEGDRHVITTTPRRSEAILMVLSGATLEEVGDQLGVSRERIRQYLQDAGLRAPDVRLVVRGPGKMMRRFLDGRRRRLHKLARIQQRIAKALTALREFAATNGRAPSYGELYRVLFPRRRRGQARGQQAMFLVSWLSRHTRQRTTRRLHALYRMAGLEPRETGQHGHKYALVSRG